MSKFDDVTEAGGLLMNILNAIAVFISLIILIIHSFRMYQDLYTKERASVLHRRYFPKINPTYKLISWSTVLSIFFFTFGKLFTVLWGFNISCYTSFAILMLGYINGKLFMYWIFLFRLKAIYGNTAYAYNNNWLNFWAVFFVFYTLLIFSMVILGNEAMKAKDNDGCVIDLQSSIYLTLLPLLLIIQDILFSGAFLIAFVLPLRKVIKLVNKHSDDTEDTRQHQKLIYSAVKTTTLTATAVISTMVIMLFLVSINLDFTYVDLIFNIVCVCLMTPYYPNSLYYQKICYCCIWCCTPKTDMYESKPRMVGATSGAEENTGVSADTMDQIKIAARNEGSGHSEQVSFTPAIGILQSSSNIDVNKKEELIEIEENNVEDDKY